MVFINKEWKFRGYIGEDKSEFIKFGLKSKCWVRDIEIVLVEMSKRIYV